MADLKDTCERLRSIGQLKATAQNRATIEAGLASKHEGIQVVAAQVLASWGGRESVEVLRRWLTQCQEKKFGWSVRGQAVKALGRCIQAEDAEWALDLCFSALGVLAKHELLPLIVALPVESVQMRLISESSSSNRDNRQAAMKAIGNMPFPNRQEWLERFAIDSDSEIREGAQSLMRSLTRRLQPAAE